MTKLVLGVIDIPYDNSGATTTVDVAKILEEKYGVMQAFYDAHQNDIMKSVVSSVEGALEDLFAGARVEDPFAEAGQAIQSEFRTFLMSGEIESMGIVGVPTQAAQKRRSLRFKGKVGPTQRPSFIDTATYELAMVAWVEK